MVELQWYPRKKLDILSAKLEGASSPAILCRELEDSRHIRQKYGATLIKDIYGASSRKPMIRAKVRIGIFERENERREKQEED